MPAETTEGMVVTRIAFEGQEIDLARRRRGDGLASVRGLNQTLAAITLVDPIPPRSKATLEIDWYTKLPGGDGGRGGHRKEGERSYSYPRPGGNPASSGPFGQGVAYGPF